MGAYGKEWKIVNIMHNGRKGIRYQPIVAEKYDGLVGSRCFFNEENIKQFKPFRLNFYHHTLYDWWNLSEVLEVWRDERTSFFYIETANSIYVFEQIPFKKTKCTNVWDDYECDGQMTMEDSEWFDK